MRLDHDTVLMRNTAIEKDLRKEQIKQNRKEIKEKKLQINFFFLMIL